MSTAEPMGVCLVLDDRLRRRYHHREIEALVADSAVEISHVLVDETYQPSESLATAGRLPAQLLEFGHWMAAGKFLALAHAERKLAEILKPEATVTDQLRWQEERLDVTRIDGLSEGRFVEFTPEPAGGATYEFPDDVVDRLAEETDVVVLLGFSKILRGRILTEPVHGVLSFHGSDISKYRGRPSAFFQYINDEEEIGLTLQQLTDELDGGRVVITETADISDVRSWKEARLRAVQLYGSLLVDGLQRLRDPDFDPTPPEEIGRLTYSRDGHDPKNVYRCLKRNVRRRYFADRK
jgi:methionyl-tRNA formyltransferase